MSSVVEPFLLVRRVERFLRKPWLEKARFLRFRFRDLWRRAVPFLPLPMRLPFGGWWLAWNDNCSDAIFNGNFEEPERRFVESFLRPGMTVLDIGAHHGFYTLLAARKVGKEGRVISFEPSPRERKKLLWHLRLNRCTNVQVAGVALGSQAGKRDFFMVKGRDTGCNSLRPPNVSEPTEVLKVSVATLDAYLRQHGIERVDFIKMDVEGAEREVLRGAEQQLSQLPRPVMLCEVQDIRTEPFGYRAEDVLAFLWHKGFCWFKILPNGQLTLLKKGNELAEWEGYNFVAVPSERLAEIEPYMVRDNGKPISDALPVHCH